VVVRVAVARAAEVMEVVVKVKERQVV